MMTNNKRFVPTKELPAEKPLLLGTGRWQTAEEVRKVYPWLTDWMLGNLRRKRLIPFLRVGHRTIAYNIDRLEAALQKLEVKEIS
jgi:hypothetical protein